MRLDAGPWRAAWQALGVHGGDALHAVLLSSYAEPHRAYHTQQHLAECLALFDEVRGLAERPAEVEIALWFHDAIYDVHRRDNEALSAEWAHAALLHAGAAADAAERVAALVLVTRHSVAPQTPDEQLLVDIDLAILGAAPSWPVFWRGRCFTASRPCASASRRPRGPIFKQLSTHCRGPRA